ncbi:hypothetical protein QFC20_004621 [Naganishia adeliensis]|uniref:Uncharacterized protein n=1 Tax=Naganishia adeliensis TaxID=92952 RepID=A0ACC2VXI7_9TREE|nr:hypothetical protein QFC20_004621 [Naganishia adeliensis]
MQPLETSNAANSTAQQQPAAPAFAIQKKGLLARTNMMAANPRGGKPTSLFSSMIATNSPSKTDVDENSKRSNADHNPLA